MLHVLTYTGLDIRTWLQIYCTAKMSHPLGVHLERFHTFKAAMVLSAEPSRRANSSFSSSSSSSASLCGAPAASSSCSRKRNVYRQENREELLASVVLGAAVCLGNGMSRVAQRPQGAKARYKSFTETKLLSRHSAREIKLVLGILSSPARTCRCQHMSCVSQHELLPGIAMETQPGISIGLRTPRRSSFSFCNAPLMTVSVASFPSYCLTLNSGHHKLLSNSLHRSQDAITARYDHVTEVVYN